MKNLFKKLNIKQKLFCSYMFLLLFLFVVLIIVESVSISQDYRKKMIEQTDREVSQSADFLSYKLNFIKNSIDMSAINDKIIDICLRKYPNYQEDFGQWAVDNENFLILIQSLEVNPDLKSLYNSSENFQLYMDGDMPFVYDNVNYRTMAEAKSQSWYSLLDGKTSTFVRTKRNKKQYLSYIKRISSSQKVDDYIGIMKVDVPEDSLTDILKQSLPSPSCTVLLLKNTDVIMQAGTTPAISNSAISNYAKDFINSDEKGVHKSIKVGSNNHTLFLYDIDVDNTTWNYMLLMPDNSFTPPLQTILNQILIMLIAIGPLASLIAYLISINATKRITELSAHMKTIVNGNFDVQILESGDDEIGDLVKNYNFMLTKISMLMDEKYRLGEKVKGLELKALQAQINPHFLYNTLDLVNLMLLRYNAPKISLVIKSLSKFYKISLSKGRSYITIKDELEHINAYLAIQNMRFDNQFKYINEFPESLYDYTIVKTVLQPIIENAIIHGILESESETGTITVSGELKDGDIYFYIKDNGVGMTPDIVEKLLTTQGRKTTKVYGLRNVNDRIKLSYGDDYGLRIESTPNVGTTITLKIKAVIDTTPNPFLQ